MTARSGPPAVSALLLAVAVVIAFVPLGAQTSQKVAPPVSPTAVVSSVRIHRENVFDKSEGSSWLAKATNGLHVVTRERVVRRELLIQEGEPYDSALAAESARNLRKLGIFREVMVDSVASDTGLQMRVATHDSWTTQIYTSIRPPQLKRPRVVLYVQQSAPAVARPAFLDASPLRSSGKLLGKLLKMGFRVRKRSAGGAKITQVPLHFPQSQQRPPALHLHLRFGRFILRELPIVIH